MNEKSIDDFRLGDKSSIATAYMILRRYFDEYITKYILTIFSDNIQKLCLIPYCLPHNVHLHDFYKKITHENINNFSFDENLIENIYKIHKKLKYFKALKKYNKYNNSVITYTYECGKYIITLNNITIDNLIIYLNQQIDILTTCLKLNTTVCDFISYENVNIYHYYAFVYITESIIISNIKLKPDITNASGIIENIYMSDIHNKEKILSNKDIYKKYALLHITITINNNITSLLIINKYAKYSISIKNILYFYTLEELVYNYMKSLLYPHHGISCSDLD